MDGKDDEMHDSQQIPTAEIPIACLIGDSTEREQRLREVEELFHQARVVDEDEQGYVFAFANADASATRLAEFVATERRCCPFLTFELRVPPAGSDITLRLSGGEGVKAFVAATFGGDE